MPLLVELATMECGGRMGLMALDQVEEGVSSQTLEIWALSPRAVVKDQKEGTQTSWEIRP